MKNYYSTHLTKTKGELNRVVFGYSGGSGHMELIVDFDGMGINPGLVQHSTDPDWDNHDLTSERMLSYNPDLEFTIYQ